MNGRLRLIYNGTKAVTQLNVFHVYSNQSRRRPPRTPRSGVNGGKRAL